MTQTTFNVGDKVQTIKTIQKLNGSGLTVHQIGTQGTVIKVHTGKLVSVTIELENGKKLTAADKDFEMVIEPAASEPTTEAAQPAHRFPVGAVVVMRTDFDMIDVWQEWVMKVVAHLPSSPRMPNEATYRVEFEDDYGNMVQSVLMEASLRTL